MNDLVAPSVEFVEDTLLVGPVDGNTIIIVLRQSRYRFVFDLGIVLL